MARARALTRSLADRSVEAARTFIVAGCALALVFAGQPLPF